jgi:hypothetical protein
MPPNLTCGAALVNGISSIKRAGATGRRLARHISALASAVRVTHVALAVAPAVC